MSLFYCFSYHKFTRGKDISNYTDKDLACILGVKKPNDISDCNNIEERKNDMDTLIGKVDNLYGVTTVNGGNMSDYFIKKKQKNVDDAPAKNHADIEKEELVSEFGDNECKAKIKTKKKQKHKNTESSNTQKREVDGQETKNELALNSESKDIVKGKKRKIKSEEGAKEEYLLKEDEESHGETDIKEYSKEDECNFTQEIETRRKHKVNPNINGKEVQQETGGNQMNDSGSYLNYKRKKRKLEKEIKEHLLVEEETVKQDGRMSVMESYNEKDMHSCELEENQVKRKKKRKEKDTDCPDAQGKEVEAERNEMTVLNGNTVTSSDYKKRKRKSKQEVKERMDDEMIEQGKRVNDNSNSSVTTVCYMSEIICEKYSLQENDECVGDQDIAPAGDKSVHKKNSSGKLKNHKSIDRNTEEIDHGETKDHKPTEEENIKHEVKKKKIRKYSKDGNIHDIEEQYNLEETLTESCNRKKCEELSVIGEIGVSVNCKNDEKKEKGKKRKLKNKICSGVELECEKDEMLNEEVDTEKNQQKLETATQNDIQNVEGSKQARSNYKQKQDVCDSDVQNSVGANIKINDFSNRDLNRRNMKPSVFAQLIDPSLIRFRGSNLRKIPGYGCC